MTALKQADKDASSRICFPSVWITRVAFIVFFSEGSTFLCWHVPGERISLTLLKMVSVCAPTVHFPKSLISIVTLLRDGQGNKTVSFKASFRNPYHAKESFFGVLWQFLFVEEMSSIVYFIMHESNKSFGGLRDAHPSIRLWPSLRHIRTYFPLQVRITTIHSRVIFLLLLIPKSSQLPL